MESTQAVNRGVGLPVQAGRGIRLSAEIGDIGTVRAGVVEANRARPTKSPWATVAALSLAPALEISSAAAVAVTAAVANAFLKTMEKLLKVIGI